MINFLKFLFNEKKEPIIDIIGKKEILDKKILSLNNLIENTKEKFNNKIKSSNNLIKYEDLKNFPIWKWEIIGCIKIKLLSILPEYLIFKTKMDIIEDKNGCCFDLHMHDCPELIIVTKGSLYIRDKLLKINENYLLDPFTLHAPYIKEKTELLVIFKKP